MSARKPANLETKKGRPPAYRPEFVEQARKLCELGATDDDLAGFFEVTARTINRWKQQHPAFCHSLKLGKDASDARVEASLYHKAVGYTFDSVKIFMPANARAPIYAPFREHVPPDTTAAIFWLKNRKPEEWRDRQQHEHSGPDGGAIQIDVGRERVIRRLDDLRQRVASRTAGLAVVGRTDRNTE